MFGHVHVGNSTTWFCVNSFLNMDRHTASPSLSECGSAFESMCVLIDTAAQYSTDIDVCCGAHAGAVMVRVCLCAACMVHNPCSFLL